VHPKRKPEEVLAAFDAEIKRIQEERVVQAEIRRAIKQARANFAYGTESITNQAFWLGHAEMFASYEWFLTYLDHLSRVTPVKMQKAAQMYLAPRNRVVGIYLPDGRAAR
jgi:zinc protease